MPQPNLDYNQNALPQDYYEDLPPNRCAIHATKRFAELTHEQEVRRDYLRITGHKCRYCDTIVDPRCVCCDKHKVQYWHYLKKAKAQAQRLCELARERRAMVTEPVLRRSDPVTTYKPSSPRSVVGDPVVTEPAGSSAEPVTR